MTTREDVYGAFVDYYGDIPLQKIKGDSGFVVYAYGVTSGLGYNRYIFVVVSQGVRQLPETTSLNRVDWASFQTRTTEEHYKVPSGALMLTDKRKEVLPDIINCIERTSDRTMYFTNELPVNITLVHDPKKNNTLQFPDQCKMYQALETYRCVVDLM